jgi:mannose-1-phosphate guanylyltransferase
LGIAKDYEDRVLIVGATPSYPEVEYGWIEPGPAVIECPTNPLQVVSGFCEKPNLATARAMQESGCLWNTFVTVGLADAFLQLLAVTVPDLLQTIANSLSGLALDRIYSKLEPGDFSKDVLSAAPERLLVLRDGPSGWTDFGSPQRAMNLLEVLAAS